MWRRRRNDEQYWNPGGIEVYATHQTGLVTIRVAPLERNEDACVFTLTPEFAREFAQRLTVASIKIEEGETDADL